MYCVDLACIQRDSPLSPWFLKATEIISQVLMSVSPVNNAEILLICH